MQKDDEALDQKSKSIPQQLNANHAPKIGQ